LSLRASGHFLPGVAGNLATVLWEPPAGIPCRFSALFLPPAGDEMNKARRTVALQARALAAIGGTVALLDPTGTGDSAGGHGDATWDAWCGDVAVAWDWLSGRAPVPRLLWGMRLGGLLACDLVTRAVISPDALLLWQPVISGRAFFNQLLRLAKVRQISVPERGGSPTPMAEAAAEPESSIEVAGYDLDPALIAGAGAVDLTNAPVPRCRTFWRETTTSTPPAISPASERVAAGWKRAGAALDIAAIPGPSFWATQEISEASELIAATTHLVAEKFVARGDHAR
jgi:exosortase A-associated hydrolase 2